MLNNYHPISNLSYISKLIECAIAAQLTAYMIANNLMESHQSAYRKSHSTETAITCVLDDLLTALDSHEVAYLSLLDCSAAFDLVIHQVLLHRLKHRLGITNTALRWFESYLEDRTQCVLISGDISDPRPLHCGVPQGSVLVLSSSQFIPSHLVTSLGPTTPNFICMLMILNFIWPAMNPIIHRLFSKHDRD